MSPSDRSIALPTGMIIAALYVILLLSFRQESYVVHDSLSRRAAIRTADASNAWAMQEDASRQVCLAESPLCGGYADAALRRDCAVSLATVRRMIDGPTPLTFEGLRRAGRDLR